ncbi:hypothetical protein GQX73_g6210 [Xylaria multiplex]|uniref:Clr5 domain-containing protein n=1 Tax=Xylaria multiplex TaxID=323545 RepID=A0A7C8N3E7_9PEZI|nr:hypothetical protein GQX73_g6210 [Xylaria multiplex]
MSSSTSEKLLSPKPAVNYAGEEKDFTIWDANRETLKRLFLTEKCTLKTVKRRMETEHDFPVFPLIHYETTLRDRYHFRKNLKASDWPSIGYHVEKRRLRGKPSRVYLGGILQDQRKVEKEIRRYNKRSILQDQIRRHSECYGSSPGVDLSIKQRIDVTPPLCQNISIRTPSPELRRNETAVVKRISVVEMAIRSELIDTLRLQSPFNQFISILMEQIMPSASVTFAAEIAQRLSVSSMEISPSLREGPGFALLSQACFILSNDLDRESIFTKALLKWIGASSELHVLRSFFSIKSPTIKAIWDILYTASINLRELRAYDILVELGLSMDKGRWVTGRLSCLIDAVNMQAMERVKELLENPDINPNLQILCAEIPGLHIYLDVTYVGPLAMAALRCNADIIKILLERGIDVNAKSTLYRHNQVLSPLFAVLEHLRACRYGEEGSPSTSAMRCIYDLLKAGSNVDVYQSYGSSGSRSCRCGWDDPGVPLWLIDHAWVHVQGEGNLLTILSEKSSKMKREITVVGVCLEANRGHEYLQQYLTSRQWADGADRKSLFQIAISEAAARGLSEAVRCLLQLGVDPNVTDIEDEQTLKYPHYLTWLPVVRAVHGEHYHILIILKDSGAYFPPAPIIKQIFDRPHAVSMTAAHSLVEFFRLDIETNGQILIFLFLQWASRDYAPICAKVCDIAWFSGTPRLIEFKFLVSRGYHIHSKLAYDYDCHSPSPSLTTTTGGPHSLSRSSMLGDALASYSFDRLAIVDYLLEQGASTENVREHFHLLESVFIIPDESQPWRWSRGAGVDERDRDTIKLFKKFFYADHLGNGPPRGELSSSVLMRLLHYQADDSLIFQVIDVTRDINEGAMGSTPLMKAIGTRRLAIAKHLLDRGAKVNHPPYLGDPKEYLLSPTALHIAAGHGRLNVVALLLKYGANINANYHCAGGKPYTTPLDYAAMCGRLDIVHLLRGLGAKSYFQGRTGVDGAISHARECGYYAIAEFLLSEVGGKGTTDPHT